MEYSEPYIKNPTTFDELEQFISIYNPSETIFISNILSLFVNNECIEVKYSIFLFLIKKIKNTQINNIINVKIIFIIINNFLFHLIYYLDSLTCSSSMSNDLSFINTLLASI